jgi:hypothetical protein
MRLRSRILLTAGLACLTTGVLAGGALAHGGHKSKFAKFSKRGHADLKVEVRGAITAFTPAGPTTPGSVSVSAAQTAPATPGGPIPLAAPVPSPGLDWTCEIPAGSTVTGFVAGDVVKLSCRSSEGKLVAYRLKAKHRKDDGKKMVQDRGRRGRGFSVEVQARGTIALADQNSITVDPGTAGTPDTLPNVTCTIGKRTRSFGTLVVGTTVKIECKSKHGVLVAKKIKQRGAPKVGQIEVKIKAPIEKLDTASITFAGGTSCAVANPNLVAGLAIGNFVEAKCTGNPLTLSKIHLEDDDH